MVLSKVLVDVESRTLYVQMEGGTTEFNLDEIHVNHEILAFLTGREGYFVAMRQYCGEPGSSVFLRVKEYLCNAIAIVKTMYLLSRK